MIPPAVQTQLDAADALIGPVATIIAAKQELLRQVMGQRRYLQCVRQLTAAPLAGLLGPITQSAVVALHEAHSFADLMGIDLPGSLAAQFESWTYGEGPDAETGAMEGYLHVWTVDAMDGLERKTYRRIEAFGQASRHALGWYEFDETT